MKSKRIEFLQLKIAPFILAIIIKILRRTMRIKFKRKEIMLEMIRNKQPFIFTFWHQRLIMMPYGYTGKNIHVLISMHRDGLMTSNTLKYFGVKSVQGSSTRGGAEGLRKIVKVTKTGADLGFTPDGPKGPARKVKPGVIQTARLTGYPILPVSYGSSRKHVLRTWDKMQLPKFFSKGVFVYGEPFYIDRKITKNEIDSKAEELEDILNKLTDEADTFFNKE